MRMMPRWLLLMLLMLLMLLLTEDLVLPMVNIPKPMADDALRRLSRTSSARGGCSSARVLLRRTLHVMNIPRPMAERRLRRGRWVYP